MKILHMTTQKPYSTGSGVYLAGILDGLGQKHVQHLICGLNAREDAAYLEEQHSFTLDPVLFQTEELPFAVPGMSDVMPYTSRRYDSLSGWEVAALKNAFRDRVLHALETFRPDVVVCQHLYLATALTATTVKAVSDLPVVGICHGSDLRQFQNNEKWRAEIQAGIGELDLILSTHREQAEVIRDLFACPPEKILILGSGFDSSIFRRDPTVIKAQRPLRLVYTGKLAAAKGVPELLQAGQLIAREHAIQLTLIGGGGDPREAGIIREMAAAQPYPVRFTGQISQAEAAAIYHRSHVFVLPSYFEGMPLVVPEALACGLKVAVTDLPGFRQWLGSYKGRVRLIPRPAMAGLDRPSEAGRTRFIQDISDAVLALAADDGAEEIDLSGLSWQALAGRISGILQELKEKGTSGPS